MSNGSFQKELVAVVMLGLMLAFGVLMVAGGIEAGGGWIIVGLIFGGIALKTVIGAIKDIGDSL